MRRDLDERHQGRRQPRHLPLALLAAALLAAALLAGCGGDDERARQILLVSGRDDHGLLAQQRVALLHAPDGTAAADGHAAHEVREGTLVRVLETRGEWIRVATLEGPRVEGWVNDYYQRGTVHVCGGPVPRGAQAELVAVDAHGVRVRTLVGEREAVVPRAALSELPCR